MRSMLWTSLLALGLAGGACKKSDTDKAAKELQKTQEQVKDEAKELDKTMSEHGTNDKDVAKARGELDEAKADLSAARDKYSIAVQDRLAKIDIKLKELDTRANMTAKDAAAMLRERRDALQANMEKLKTRTSNNWDQFTKDIDGKLDAIEKDVDDALK